jgi:hypothetical protein
VAWLAVLEDVPLNTTDNVFIEPPADWDDVKTLASWYVDGGWLERPDTVPSSWIYDAEAQQWVDPLTVQDYRNIRWTAVKQARDTAINAPLPTPYGSFDADPRSQKNITDAIALLQALEASGTPQTIDFTLSDNSVAVLTTVQMVQVGLLLGARTQEAYATARQLRTDIEAAGTQEEVEAVVWPVDTPS